MTDLTSIKHEWRNSDPDQLRSGERIKPTAQAVGRRRKRKQVP